jgi:predicted nucleic acid-binding protein
VRKIFVDANLVIDLFDSASKDHKMAESCFQIIRRHFGRPVVSPITFVITNFLLGKFVKNKQWHYKQMQLGFSEMDITALHPAFIDAIFKTNFTDLEDELQYQCALHARVALIITKDIHDYFDSKIPVVHPHDFVIRYNRLFEN